MKKLLRFICGILSIAILQFVLVVVHAESTEYATGYEADSNTWINNHLYSSEPTVQSFPTAVDNSTSPYFPDIGNQGQIGCCTSFATTYYQFTYEANKLNNIFTTPENTYCPMWSYNYCNDGLNKGTSFENNYNILKNVGALRYSDYDFTFSMNKNDSANYTYWSNNTPAKLEALETRVSSVYALKTPVSNGNIISFNSGSTQLHAFDAVKMALTSGKVLTVTTTAYEWDIATATNNQKIIVHSTRQTNRGLHAVTIVGYNDNIACDVNGDGVIQANEKGAFKIANSWGSNYQNNGYVWVLYDAFNTYNDSTRSSFLYEPYFYYIIVSNYDVNFVGEITFTSSRRNQFYSSYGITSNSITAPTTNNPTVFGGKDVRYYTNGVAFSGSLIFDLKQACNRSSGYNWHIGVEDYYPDGQACSNISYKIIDNKNVTIKDFGVIATTLDDEKIQTYRTIDCPRGDLDYSEGLNNKDLSRLKRYLEDPEGMNFSNVQIYLADVNADGYINNKDYSRLKQILAEG